MSSVGGNPGRTFMLFNSCVLVVLLNVAVSQIKQIPSSPSSIANDFDFFADGDSILRFLEVDRLEPFQPKLKLSLATSINPIMWNITIFHPLPHVLGNTQPSAEHPMICDFVVLTATNEQAPNATTTNGFHGFRLEYTRRLAAAEDRRLAHTACLLNFSPVAETQLGKNEAKVIKYRAVLHALGMINRKRILSPPYTAQKPPILLLDDNTFVTNTHMTIFDLFRRIDMGCTYMPAAEQFCEPLLGGECNLPSSGKAATPKTRMKKYASERYHPDFFFIANLEADCYTPWAISAGALVFKPHTLSKLLLEAIILTAVSGVQHQFYGYDQGSLNFALSELFNVDHNKLRNLCYPYSEEFWNMSTGGDQLIFDVELNQGNLESHFIFNILHKKYQKALAELDRSSRLGDRALIVNPRWLAPPACPGYLNHKQRSALSWHAQDFIARFNGCDGGKAIHSDVFVKRASSDLALLPLSDGKLRMSGTFRAQPLEDPTARPWAVLSP